MRALALIFLALAAAGPVLAEDLYVQAPVAAVTVYPNGAQMVRRASLTLEAGKHRVFLPYGGPDTGSNLPRIRSSEGVTVGAIGLARNVPVDREDLFTNAQAAAWSALKARERALAQAKDAVATARADAAGLRARLEFLAKVKPGQEMAGADVVAMADTLAAETQKTTAALVAAKAALRPLLEARDQTEKALAAAQDAFDRLSPPGDLADMLSVDIAVAKPGPVTLELTEPDPGASWQMDYDFDLDRDAGRLAIARKVVVQQDSGMNWNGVALTLSTARPADEIAPSPVSPDRARIEPPMTVRRLAPSAVGTEAFSQAAPAPVMADAAQTTAVARIDGLALSYVYPDPVALADGSSVELALDTLTLDATPSVKASPRYDATAFTVASFTNTTGEPLLPGRASFLRDGHFVGRDVIGMIPAGASEELGFGPVEGIRLATVFERNAEGDSGLITKSNTREQRITFSVENLTDKAQKVRAIYPLAFSEQEDLKLRVSAVPAPDETDLDHKRGVSAWDLTLAPGEKKQVAISVKLAWPEDMNLLWQP